MRRVLKSELYGCGRRRKAEARGSGHDQKTSSIARPASMQLRPRKRIWPSLIRIAFSKICRQDTGLMKGSRPSATSISATALRATSQKPAPAKRYFLAAGAAGCRPLPRSALKNSLPDGSITIRSPLLRKLAR